MRFGAGTAGVAEAIDRVGAGVTELQQADLEALGAEELLAQVRELELVRRRLDSVTDSVAGRLDSSGFYGFDGHRSAKCAIKHLGRLPGGEAWGRVSTARALRLLPACGAAYAKAMVPTASMRVIARVASNPRVRAYLQGADAIFAEQAAQESYDDFAEWIREWERLADADGAAQASEMSHRRRDARVVENTADGSWMLQARGGALHGAIWADVLEAFVAAEVEADRAEAIETHGPDATADQYRRTAAQRRADALLAIFRTAAGTPPDGQSAEPLINILIDAETFEEELRRAAGEDVESDPNRDQRRTCRTTTGHPCTPPTPSPPR